LNKAAQYVRDAGGLVIFDEVQAGFGRTGFMWGYQSAGVVPDIVTLGKPMGNGHPLAVLDVIEQESLIANAQDVGDYLRAGLLDLKDRYALIGDVRHRGLFVAVELVGDRVSKEPATDRTKAIVESVKQQGALISKIGPFDNVLKIRPPICFSRDNADMLLSMLDNAFAELGEGE
jgi:4-aminobutyrate aminotransferase-like enzyme